MKLPALDIARQLPIKLSAGTLQLHRIYKNRYDFDFDVYLPKYGKNLQRPYVWSAEKQGRLIESLIRDFEIPALTLVETTNISVHNDPKLLVIDGKQRLTTIILFFRNELKVSFKFEISGKEYGFSGYFKDLPESYQSYITGKHLKTLVGYDKFENGKPVPIPCDDLIELFSILNYGGEPLDLQHIQKIKTTK